MPAVETRPVAKEADYLELSIILPRWQVYALDDLAQPRTKCRPDDVPAHRQFVGRSVRPGPALVFFAPPLTARLHRR